MSDIKSTTDLPESPSKTRLRGIIPLAIVALIVTELVVDFHTPRGFSDWMSYFIPILLTSWLNKRWTIGVTSTVSLLNVIGFIVSPPLDGIPSLHPEIGIINRTIGIIIFWTTAVLVNLRREGREKLEYANRELAKKTERLIEVEKLKNEFLADASHELRTPLAIMKSHLDLALGKRSKKFTDPYRALKEIDAEIEHVSKIIADVNLLANSAAAPRHILAKTEVRLKDEVSRIVKGYAVLAKNKHIKIISKMSGITLHGDQEKLERLFSNLLGNAIKYGKEGGHVYIAAWKDSTSVTIEFKDDGIGIPKEDLPHIFERFYRVEKARTRAEGGVGLGLSICKWIAEAHGGTLEVSSVQNEGSTFTVKIPTAS